MRSCRRTRGSTILVPRPYSLPPYSEYPRPLVASIASPVVAHDQRALRRGVAGALPAAAAGASAKHREACVFVCLLACPLSAVERRLSAAPTVPPDVAVTIAAIKDDVVALHEVTAASALSGPQPEDSHAHGSAVSTHARNRTGCIAQ